MPSTLVITPWNPPSSATSYSVLNVAIDSYHCEPVLAGDGNTPTGESVKITGSGIVTAAEWTAMRDLLQKGGRRCNTVTLIDGGNDLVNLTRSASSLGGPIATVTATDIVGSGLAMLKFEITDERTFSGLPVAAHTWTQRMQIDATGKPTRTISGNLKVWRGSTTTLTAYPSSADAATWIAEAPWADWFRYAAVPLDLRQGWRRESQEFALDEKGTSLVYTIVDRLYAQDLPDGVRVGDADFSYERSLENPAVAQVSFSCDLEGGLELRGVPGNANGVTGNRALVAAAVQLSRTRIDATLENTLIQRLKVTEKEILSGYAIRFELDAQILPNGDPSGASVALKPLSAAIGRHFHVVRSTSRTVGPYGLPRPVTSVSVGPGGNPQPVTPPSGDVYAMVQHYLTVAGASRAMPASPATSAGASDMTLDGLQAAGSSSPMPCAQAVYFTEDCLFGNITQTGAAGTSVYIVQETATLVAGMNEYVANGKYASTMTQPATPGTIISYNTGSTRCEIDSGFRILNRMRNDLPDAAYQARKPRVVIRERTEIVRLNQAPSRVMRPLPSAAILLGETWDVSVGRFDAQGNRQFVGVYERRVQMRDWGAANTNAITGFKTATANNPTGQGGIVGPSIGDYRHWSAPASKVNAPASQIIADNSQEANEKSVLDPITGSTPTDPQQSYPTSIPAPRGMVGGT